MMVVNGWLTMPEFGAPLATASANCHGAPMANTPNSAGGGIFIALGAFAGVAVGRFYGQTSLGLIVGVAAGVGLAVLLWLRDRLR